MKSQSATAQLKPIFRFPVQDSEARNRFITGCALMLGGFIVPVIPALFAYGYALRILRSTAEGKPPSMPAWEDWTSLLSLGLRGMVVGLVFTLPAMAVFLFGLAAYMGSFVLIPFIESAEGSVSDPLFLLFLLGMASLFFAMAFGSLLLLLGAVPLPASLAHFVVRDRFGAAFRAREWWPILSANRLGYLMAFVIVAGIFAIGYYAFFVLYSTLILMCLAFLVMPPIMFYSMLVGSALFGEIYREGHAALEQPARPAAPRAGARSPRKRTTRPAG